MDFSPASSPVQHRLIPSRVLGRSRLRLAGRGGGGRYDVRQRRRPFPGVNLVHRTRVARPHQRRHRLVLAGEGSDGREASQDRAVLGRRGLGLGPVGWVVASGTGHSQHIAGRVCSPFTGLLGALGRRLGGAANQIVYWTTMPLGFLVFVLSLWLIWRRHPAPQPAVG